LWGDTLGFIWGRRNKPIEVPIKNEKSRQTYYGAMNLFSGDFHLLPYDAGNGVNTVAYVKELQAVYPQSKLLLIWDGASYHKYAEMQAYLQDSNQGLREADWPITCELFAPNAPEQNPVEDIWLKGKTFLRKFFYKNSTFAQVKTAFFEFLNNKTFSFPKLNMYLDL
jgi:transposase